MACTMVAGCGGGTQTRYSGNPIFEGWYADPHAVIYGDKYWVYATYSAEYSDQVFMDCFSSDNLVDWVKHERIIDTDAVAWADSCIWAPAPIEKDGKYYLFFAANDVHEGQIGGIGVGVADRPEGPYEDLLGRPLVNEIVNGAQPIDQFVWEEDGRYLMYYGGWGHCNVVRLSDDFSRLLPFEDGTIYKEITPENYVEGSFMIK
ncbi:MAG: family 43 glycosylhydrolase, partial [Alistipes sp.]|nr:family 43 glycosylhydrolase [Alistipes sp.]